MLSELIAELMSAMALPSICTMMAIMICESAQLLLPFWCVNVS